ncbi:conserved hypothetical protein [Roseibium sp. TrichSKD4]|uniref:hypothetical protein n=1 Tax=Roseibium sp. TrichSKD4 TaxID=744980 RepID=UPI0001E56D3B|nr:hypothetical protein [Roseibium sp. TrichSKD4]EFO33252.1 conserved hypothetical protein [Roseibium sp. TrichSKD4]
MMSIQLEMRVTASKPIYRGHDHYWSVIRELGKNGAHFTKREIGLRSNDRNDRAIGDFLKRLLAANFVEVVDQITAPFPHGGYHTHNVYRLLKRPSVTPIINRDGTRGTQGLAQRNLWRTIRILSQFDLQELALLSSTPEIEVPRSTAKKYVSFLSDAGYLQIMRKGRGSIAQIWRLKASMNTGPKPPKILSTKVVYDANLKKVMGTPVAEELAA